METKEEVIKHIENKIRLSRNEIILDEYYSSEELICFIGKRISIIKEEIIEIDSDINREYEIIEMYEGDPFDEEIKKQFPKKDQEVIRIQIETARPILKSMGENFKKEARFRKEKWINRKSKLENELVDLQERLKGEKLIFETLKERYNIKDLKKESLTDNAVSAIESKKYKVVLLNLKENEEYLGNKLEFIAGYSKETRIFVDGDSVYWTGDSNENIFIFNDLYEKHFVIYKKDLEKGIWIKLKKEDFERFIDHIILNQRSFLN
jgi:hypothetical protein